MFDTRTSGSDSGGIFIRNDGTGGYLFGQASNAIASTGNTVRTPNAWGHLALVRSGTSMNLYFNGISVANGYVATGTKSRDRTLIRESNGEVIYRAGTLGFDTHMDSAFTGPVFGFGNLVTDASSGRPIAKVGGNAVKHSILNGDFAISTSLS